ncbi:Peptide-N4-(N-acetyl-beta-glucosaminyl)asparagine amidase A [Vitis vinifera]|uniref:Peptide-N4-(N-acetyl-beta-glucosaminyl)asparagine amidase A n=1 Tax=Vitis vinifera TaxID=29760 RepID=A0A438J4Q6_VITVI|nr:Peptide-N4-(N-acetyl-beta-glucosaminyl)asparagine amidase A [Vitis vinifera]
MAASLLPLLLFSLFFLLNPPSTTANLHKSSNLLRSQLLSQPKPHRDTPPIRFFEVTKPIKVPKTKPCSSLVLQHDFGYTYGKPPVLAPYSPPAHCPSQNFSKIVLEWSATCKGRQFDRIFGVWLGGVELLRSCTAEPTATGIVWTVKKDVTRYYSLLMKEETLAVYLGNVVDKTYTGVYHVNVTFHFYPAAKILKNLDSGAVLEVYLSFHENDEFWYSNPPNDYISANNLTGTPGNGPFREVLVGLDDANLHIWWTIRAHKLKGGFWAMAPGSSLSTSTLYMKGLNASFLTLSSRSISSTGWVKSSHGKMTTQSIQEFKYINLMVMGNDGDLQTVNQTIHFNDGVYTKFPYSFSYSINSSKLFPLYLYSDNVDRGNGTYLSLANTGQGSMIVKNNLVSSGLGSTQEVYNYGCPKFCYFRNVSSSNYTILYDTVSSSCRRRPQSQLDISHGEPSLISFDYGYSEDISTRKMRNEQSQAIINALKSQCYSHLSSIRKATDEDLDSG